MDTGMTMTRHWWALALRGAVAVLFGLATIIWPGLTLGAIVALFGAFALVDGIFAAGVAVGSRGRGRHWIALLVGGILGILVGITTFFLPDITALSLVYLIAAWSVVTGIAGIVAVIQRRGRTAPDWLMGFSSLLSILFGLVLFAAPGAGALSLVRLIGVYAVIFGGFLFGAGVRFRAHGSASRSLRHAPSGA